MYKQKAAMNVVECACLHDVRAQVSLYELYVGALRGCAEPVADIDADNTPFTARLRRHPANHRPRADACFEAPSS